MTKKLTPAERPEIKLWHALAYISHTRPIVYGKPIIDAIDKFHAERGQHELPTLQCLMCGMEDHADVHECCICLEHICDGCWSIHMEERHREPDGRIM